MSKYLSLSRTLRRFAGAVAVAGFVILGLFQASPAAAAPRTCPFFTLNGRYVYGDPAAYYSLIGGYYTREEGIAYKVTGQFPHSTTYTWTAQDDYTLYPAPQGGNPESAYTLTDNQIAPAPGSVNPFLSGHLVSAPNRNYTLWVWPDSIPVPHGLKNVVRFTTKPADPTDKLIRWSVVARHYEMQPGYTVRRSLPTVQAVETSNPNVVIPCPFTKATEIAVETVSFAKQITTFVDRTYRIPEPTYSNRIYFTRTPAEFIAGPEGAPVGGAVNYLGAGLDPSKISVITMHRTPTFFNNQVLAPDALFGQYQVRFMSFVSPQFPVKADNAVNSNFATYQPDGSWVTVMLPSKPRLKRSEARQVRAKAALLGYNVVQEAAPSAVYPSGAGLAVRYKAVAPDFCCSVTKVPSWVDPDNPATAHNDYRDFGKQDSPKFFATYASNPSNMGPYWVGGVKETFDDFMKGS